jgi:hypothetical protein
MILVAGDVLKVNLHHIGWHSFARSLGPFDDDNRVTVDNVIPGKVREVIGTSQTVKVQMKDSCALRMIFVHERECRTGHIFANSNTATDSLCQRRLPGAEVALESDDRGFLETAPKFFAPLLQLVNRES